jgi:hypothetical protein
MTQKRGNGMMGRDGSPKQGFNSGMATDSKQNLKNVLNRPYLNEQ